MGHILVILAGGVVWGGALYWFLNLTNYVNLTKALLCIFTGVMIFLILKILDPLINKYEK